MSRNMKANAGRKAMEGFKGENKDVSLDAVMVENGEDETK